jgi:hypothetical protein
MTNEDCEKIVELVFQKMLAKQKEWDEQDFILGMMRLTILKANYIKDEEYLKAAEIQKQIDDLKITNNR